jgi:serine/threonine protein kinase
MSVVKMTETPEVFLGKYRAFRLLGEGGMGQVYYGQAIKGGQEVVIKVMHDHLAEVPAIRQSFRSELQLMMQFHHPYSVRLIDGSLEGPGRPCLVMEYIDGVSLEDHAERYGRFKPELVGRWLTKLCQCLHAAHASNILHRDLTLNNLMLTHVGQVDEAIKVMDFGLARLASAYFIPFEKLTGTGTHLGGGTPDYVAPEQARGEEMDQRGDLYSVGVGLYRLLCGQLPFQEFTDPHKLIEAHLKMTPPTFAERGVTDIPAPVEGLVRQLLSKIPAERPGSAKELAIRYQQAIHGQPPPADAFNVTPISAKAVTLYDESSRLDCMEAWMPESVAIMKLRAFAESVGGEIASSEPGKIRIRLRDPRTPEPEPSKSGIFAIFRRPTLPPPVQHLHLDLYMQKHQHGTRSMVEIAVVMEPEEMDSEQQAEMRSGFGQRICRELRAYLMIGR